MAGVERELALLDEQETSRGEDVGMVGIRSIGDEAAPVE